MNQINTVHKFLIIWVLIMEFSTTAIAQCPPNIDFEYGDFEGWNLFSGTTSGAGGVNNIFFNSVILPEPGRHQMYSSVTDANLVDPFGGFPVVCPNGSGHSIKLGNAIGNGQAEGVSYTFTIPANANTFSLTYYYAVVFQDPAHLEHEQPRLKIEIQNITDGTVLGCSSFSFVANSSIPGFYLGVPSDNTPVWCKNWTANTVNLNGNAGNTIKLFFKTADCTYQAHFGYAYIDVNTNCTSTFTGANYCATDTSVTVAAPTGYQNYQWYNNNYTQLLGTSQQLFLTPPPPSGTLLNVVLTPFAGYGCVDTLSAAITSNAVITADAGPDVTNCNNNAVQIGRPPEPQRIYSWFPTNGLSNPNIANPIANVSQTTTYYLTVKSLGGGCATVDTVTVFVTNLDKTITVVGPTTYCEGANEVATLKVNLADSIQWYKNGAAIVGENNTDLIVSATGDYYAKLFGPTNNCSVITATKKITVHPAPVASFSANSVFQCLPDNNFIFTNLDQSPTSNTYNYLWSFGDGTSATTKNTAHHFNVPGNYTVSVKATTNKGCTTQASTNIVVAPGAKANFATKSVCINQDVTLINTTDVSYVSSVNYLWDFGDGQTSTSFQPVIRYTTPGNYTVKLFVTNPECPTGTEKIIPIKVEAPINGIRYSDQIAITNFPLILPQRNISNSVLWQPATFLNSATIFKPTFRGSTEQLYTIKMTTAAGCVTVDTLQVNVLKKIAIYVPTAFTPNADGTNDNLKPLLYGFKKVQYFRVYNRQGQLLFQMNSDTPGWDGKLNGQLQERQTLVWVLAAEDVDGKMHQAKGTTILMR